MLPLTSSWQMELDRGPDWLFVHLVETDQTNAYRAETDSRDHGLAEALWGLMQDEFTHRLVLDMDRVALLRSAMLSELLKLHKRVTSTGGLMRLCRLSDSNQQVLQLSRLGGHFPAYASREEAVMGHRPTNPR